MKKTLLTLTLLLAVCFSASAQTWHTANQATIAWNAVTTLDDDSAIPATDQIKYQVYLKNAADVVTPYGAEVDTLQAVITFTVEGNYFIGVKAIRYDSADVMLSESTIAWSDTTAAPDPFGFTFYRGPAQPQGLRTQ